MVSRTASVLLATAALSACAASPRPLAVNEDACDYCRMTVADVRIGGEVLSAGGRLRTFDSITCLIGFLQSRPPEDQRGAWVADYATGRMVAVDSALFLRNSRLRSPMGRDGDIIAFAPGVQETTLVARHGGEVVAWSDALAARAKEETPSTPDGRTDGVPATPPRR